MKRLIICCEGTWERTAGIHRRSISRLAQAICPMAVDGTPQIVQRLDYDHHLRKSGQSLERAALLLLDREIQDSYRFLVDNHVDGDQIWFFGFGRGAYVARSCIGLIRNAGLLKKTASRHLSEAYRLYRTRWGADASNAREFRARYSHPVEVKFLGVLDTAGSRGIPAGLLDNGSASQYHFHDTRLSGIVSNAYHAVAIDEHRPSYSPALWKTNPERTHTEQCWFSGSHSDMGGADIADTPLRWLADKAIAAGLSVDSDHLDSLLAEKSSATADNSDTATVRKRGTRRRAIGVTNHDETLHSTAEQRFLRNTDYRPANLREYLARDEQIQLPI